MKKVTVCLTESGKSFSLNFCKSKRVNESLNITIGERIQTGSSPKKLSEAARVMGFQVVNPPTEATCYFSKKGWIDWNGEVAK